MDKREFFGINVLSIIVSSINQSRIHSVRCVSEIAEEAESAVMPISNYCRLGNCSESSLN